MSNTDPIELIFGGLEKLGPSSEATTREAIRALPSSQFSTIVDAGCGTGAQTLILADELRQHVHAVDNNELFLCDLRKRADETNLGEFVSTHCFDLSELADRFPQIDLLWSEGAAYSIGFTHALKLWSQAIARDGLAVVSELCWLKEEIPDAVQQFFREGYPDMKTVDKNVSLIEEAGFRILGTRILSDDCWIEGYYDILEPRAQSLQNHSNAEVRDFAAGTLQEIEIHRQSHGSYGYVLFALQRLSEKV